MPVQVVVGDIFHAPLTHAIAHCVAMDLKMNAGFAKVLKEKYGGTDELRLQKLSIGEIGYLERDRKLLYIVTKEKSNSLPTKDNFNQSLVALRSFCESMNIQNLSCPLIGCGRDKLNQEYVLGQLKLVFVNSAVNVCLWRWKFGSSNGDLSLLTPEIMLAGDSNFLRVLGAVPGTRVGHVISGGTLLSVQYSLLQSIPEEKVFVMVGTNDLLCYEREKLSKSQALNALRSSLRRFCQSLKKKSVNFTMLTIPPCPLLQISSPITVDLFNYSLLKLCKAEGIPVLDVHSVLSGNVNKYVSKKDLLHLTCDGIEVVKNFILR